MNPLLAADAEPPWTELAPHLEAALAQLDQPERDAIMLRYFEKKSAPQMAAHAERFNPDHDFICMSFSSPPVFHERDRTNQLFVPGSTDAAPESGQGWRPDGTARLGSTRFAVWTVQSLDDSQIAISE